MTLDFAPVLAHVEAGIAATGGRLAGSLAGAVAQPTTPPPMSIDGTWQVRVDGVVDAGGVLAADRVGGFLRLTGRFSVTSRRPDTDARLLGAVDTLRRTIPSATPDHPHVIATLDGRALLQPVSLGVDVFLGLHPHDAAAEARRAVDFIAAFAAEVAAIEVEGVSHAVAEPRGDVRPAIRPGLSLLRVRTTFEVDRPLRALYRSLHTALITAASRSGRAAGLHGSGPEGAYEVDARARGLGPVLIVEDFDERLAYRALAVELAFPFSIPVPDA